MWAPGLRWPVLVKGPRFLLCTGGHDARSAPGQGQGKPMGHRLCCTGPGQQLQQQAEQQRTNARGLLFASCLLVCNAIALCCRQGCACALLQHERGGNREHDVQHAPPRRCAFVDLHFWERSGLADSLGGCAGGSGCFGAQTATHARSLPGPQS